jgi:class 3 adenylate cyclase
MAEPRIQYARTKDGVSIAFFTLGEGMPVVYMPSLPWSHIQLEWQALESRGWYECLSERRMLVRYDNRGSGLSERDVVDFSLDAHLMDLTAVVDRVGLERFVLFASSHAGPVAIAYAAHHPERVTHLILWCTWARTADYTQMPAVGGMRELMRSDWELYTESFGHAAAGFEGGEGARRMAAFFREAVQRETVLATMEGADEFASTDLLPLVKSPTLVMHRRWLGGLEVTLARAIVSGIPDARLAALEGASPLAFVGDMEAVLRAINEFLGEGEETPPAPDLPEGMAVLLFADIAESTALTEQLGDAAFRAKAREMDTSLRSVVRDSGGTPVEGKVLGDGVLAVFTSARQAIDCALRCEAAGEPLGLRLHLGIHAGDVIREGNNVYGGAVNIAARIAAASAPGEVLVSDVLRGLARTSAGVTFDDRGEHELKGVGEPQRLFAVRGGG